MHREEALLDEIDSSREHQARLEGQLDGMQAELAAHRSGGGVDRRRFADLQARHDQLKEEQTQLYRTQSSNVQKLLDMNEQLRAMDAQRQAGEASLGRAKDQHALLARSIEDLTGLVAEKNLNIQLMQDELTALQLELLKLDERNDSLEAENRSLVDRWLARASITADLLNGQLVGSPPAPRGTPGPAACPSARALAFRVDGKKEVVNMTVINRATDQFALCTSYPSVAVHAFADGSRARLIRGGPKTGIVSGCFNTPGDLFVGTTHSSGGASPSIYMWHVPTEKIRMLLSGHEAVVSGAAFMPGDDTKLVTCSHDQTIKVWDLPRNLCLRTIDVKSEANSVVTGSFGLASVHRDGAVVKWDERASNPAVASASAHAKAVLNACVSNDGRELITSSMDHTVKIIDAATLQTKLTLRHDNFKACSEGCLPSIDAGGRLVAAGSVDGSLFIWNRTQDGQLEALLTGHESSVTSTSWSSKSGTLASSDRAGSVIMWR